MSKTILLIEDSEVDYELFTRIIKDVPVTWVKSTSEASSYMASISDNELPSIIVLDLNLPAENGIKLIQRLKTSARFRSIPVVVLSSIAEQKEIDSCYTAGANAYLEKSLKPQDLTKKLLSLVEFWLVSVHLPLL